MLIFFYSHTEFNLCILLSAGQEKSTTDPGDTEAHLIVWKVDT